MPAPSKTGSHKTFVDDDTYGEEAAPLGRQISEPALPPAQEEESDSGSEVEEIATASTRQAARAQTAAEHKRKEQEHAARREKHQRHVKPAHASRRARRAPPQDAEEEAAGTAMEEDEHAEAAHAAPARLDPALFAAAFAHRDAQARAALQPRASTSRPKKTHARGVDGQPMVRVRGARTVVRALAPEETAPVADAPLTHTPLDPARALPSARVRGFRKRTLGLRPCDVRANAIDGAPRVPAAGKRAASRAASRHANDPLGLEDPAMATGGARADRARAKRARTSSSARPALGRGVGARVQAPHAPRMGPAQNFVRRR